MSPNMPQESPSNDNNKSKRRFSGRRDYVDTFRWGFVSEEETGKTAPPSAAPKSNAKKTSSPVAETAPDSAPKPKQNQQRKKAAKIAAPKPTVPKTATKAAPKAKTNESNTAKQPTKPLTKQAPEKQASADPPAPKKHTLKGKGRSKSVVSPYVAQNKYSEEDEDLKLPSYGRTPIPKDDELPVPQKKTTDGRRQTVEERQQGRSVQRETVTQSGNTAADSRRPHREQMVWDPDKREYVPLVVNKKPEPVAPAPKTPERRANAPEKNRCNLCGKKPTAKCAKTAKPTKEPVTKPKATEPKTSVPKVEKPTEKPKVEKPKQERPQPPPKKQTERPDVPRAPQQASEPKERLPRQRDSRRNRVPQFVESSLPDPADIEAEVSGFAELGVSDVMLEALRMVRYLEPTPIQAGVFQKVQAGTDLMGQAQTGTGKTAAFSMPIIEGVETCPPGNDPVALILVPTRELAVQVRDEAMRLAYGRDVRITACYGGKPLAKQIERLKNGIDILVGTPGRLLDLMNRRALSLHAVCWVVLDEADRMLDIGFRPDIEKILRRTPQERQTLLFSATLPPPVVRLAEKYMKSPEVLDFSNKSVAVDTIDQFYVTVDPERKFDALVHLLQEQQPQQAIIFTRTKRGADRLARLLTNRFDKLAAIHGDLQQSERDSVMARVRSGSLKYLVATDVVGRGIDVTGISHIINYDIPKFCDDYVHRVGRTGRMGREGIAFTFVTAQEGSELTRIEMRIDKLLKRAELKGFESFTKPHDPNASLDEETQPEPSKPVFGKPIRKVRRAL